MGNDKMSYLKGIIYVFLSAIAFASYGVWSKLLGEGFGVFFQGWVRSAIVLAILIPIVYFTGNWKKMERKDWKWLSVPVLFGIFTQAPLYYAYIHAGIGIATVLFFAMFLLTSYIVGWFVVKEKMNYIKITSFLLAVLGLFITFGFSIKEFSLIALSMAAVNGVASGGEVATTKKVTNKYSSLQVTILIWVGILITHLIASLLVGEQQIIPAFDIHWLAMLGYVVTGIGGFWLVVEGFKFIDASIGGLIGLLEIVFGVLFGIMWFNEILTPAIAVGSIIILIAAALPSLKELKR